MSFHPNYSFKTIGVIHSCYTQKFGIPRQPGLVNEATATLELLPPFNRVDVIEGLEDFSHIWIQFIFHECIKENWKAKVRPPRLGGKQKVGIFSSRATHRPNPLGLSVVKLGRIYQKDKQIFIELHGSDLLDGTPIVDIKPYLPYADIVQDAKGGFAPSPPKLNKVTFSPLANKQCKAYLNETGRNAATLISEILSQDPRPSYLHDKENKQYGIQLWDINIRWQAKPGHFKVLYVEKVKNEQPDIKGTIK
ncbi:tRNA (N6-threonylcarbamoyladenosine(37)-N6)-methyltransferase TrmO [Marinomonas sp. 15G1-11]|uniref:tRNA (N6-threonylcarbamoyladenosine(37)-N6)-methyltransferase TrmO n=1 Tax=Marinomonas phaeophyticola TaxID=3004091 RepID=A0ABT4JYS0_9GAMM|nr:tRNA (N6-threonylcarbamoyladenosine(37)-N6)-methyltransferase TrmO [Marinomonas sp. 15G1-11]MCZ2723371.1 tRNA (N6-threonylcarbamoyladenosine(37)-N6)-methyltransferase TrmO [Marinomonas sp. 15G1-11]